MPISNEIRDELETIRQCLLEMLVPLQTPEGTNRDSASDQERLRWALWAAVRDLDPLLSEAQLPQDVDLTKDDPTVQQLLYALVVRDYFSVRLLADEGDIDVPQHTPEECGLQVFFQFGRWFVTWTKLEENMNRPEGLTRELLRFERDSSGQLVFTEV